MRHITRLYRENNETQFSYAAFIGESTEYVLNQLVDTVLAKDRDSQAWQRDHPGTHVPRPGSRRTGRARGFAALVPERAHAPAAVAGMPRQKDGAPWSVEPWSFVRRSTLRWRAPSACSGCGHGPSPPTMTTRCTTTSNRTRFDRGTAWSWLLPRLHLTSGVQSRAAPPRRFDLGLAFARLFGCNALIAGVVRTCRVARERCAGMPFSMPSALMSSSTSGQCAPWPSPMSCQLARCGGVASDNRQDHASGTLVLFRANSQSGIQSALHAVSPDGGEQPREVAQPFARSGNWTWLAPHPDGRVSAIGSHLKSGPGFYTSSRDGTKAFGWKLGKDGQWTQLAQATQRFQWNADGTTLYVEAVFNEVRNVWRVRVDPDTREWVAAERLTAGAGQDVAAAVAAGRRSVGVQRASAFYVAREGSPPAEWIRIAANHPWADKPRWAPNGKLLYFISNQGSPYFNLWGVRFDPDRGTPMGDPFPLTRFDTPGLGLTSHRMSAPRTSASRGAARF